MADFPLLALHAAWVEAVAQLTTVQRHLDHLLALDEATWPRPVSVEVSLRLMHVTVREALAGLQRVPTPCLEVVADVWRTLEEAHVEAPTPETKEG